MSCPKCIDDIVFMWPDSPPPCKHCSSRSYLSQFNAREAEFKERNDPAIRQAKLLAAKLAKAEKRRLANLAKKPIPLAELIKGKSEAEIVVIMAERNKRLAEKQAIRSAKRLAKAQAKKARDNALIERAHIDRLVKRLMLAIAELETRGLIAKRVSQSRQRMRDRLARKLVKKRLA